MIVGAGPAGASAALSLASTCRVLMLDRWATPPSRIGESLAAAARRLLIHMELWEAFLREGHAPSYLKQSRWGGPEITFADSMRDLDGPGYCLDRARFESFLRDAAVARGVELLAPARAVALDSEHSGFRVQARLGEREVVIRAPVLIDAAGRTSRCMQALGEPRLMPDRLMCLALAAPAHGDSPAIAYTESDRDGYWYTTRVPDGRRILSFHTDSDLPSTRALRFPGALLAKARASSTLRELIADGAFAVDRSPSICAAYSSRLGCAARVLQREVAWLAVGDSAMSFDPLSSQGLFHALFTGCAAARAVAGFRAGAAGAVEAYAQALDPVWRAYCGHLQSVYAQEQRWSSEVFWQRRQTIDSGLSA